MDFEDGEEPVEFLCEACDAIFTEPGEVTEEIIREHYEEGGFERVPASAFERIGDPCCPECGSQFYERQ